MELLGKAAQGKDPVHERDTGKATPTLAEFAQRYLSEYAAPHKKPATLTADLSLLGLDEAPGGSTQRWIRNDNKRTILEALGPVRIDVIGPAHVTRLHLAWKGTPTRANRALALLQRADLPRHRVGIV